MTVRSALLASLLLAFAHVGPAQPVFRAGVEAVRIDVVVSVGGRAVAGLSAEDFELTDDGVRQTVQFIDQAEVPVDLTLVLDTSTSVIGERRQRLIEAGHAVVAALGPRDRSALLTFTNEIAVRQPLTGNAAETHQQLDRVAAMAGATALRDALFVAAQLPYEREHRALLIVFTDGLDNLSWLGDEQVRQAFRASTASLYAMTPPTRADSLASRSETSLLGALASDTGGLVWRAPSESAVRDGFLRALAEVKAAYTLAYYPTSTTPGWHDVRVRLRGRRGAVRARRGYVARGSDAPW